MLTLAAFALVLGCAAVPACTCVPRPRPASPAAMAAALAGEAAVFDGTVLRVTFAEDSAALPHTARGRRWFRWTDRVATLAVARAWKGDLPGTVVVRTPQQTTMCGAELVAGRRYLVFAVARDDSHSGVAVPAGRSTALATDKCGLTREFDAEARRLARLLSRAPDRTAQRSRPEA